MKTSYLYCGDYPNQRVNGIFKIGMTQTSPSNRQNNITYSNKHKFRITHFIKIKSMAKEEILYVESYVRLKMAKEKGLRFDETSNDHFKYKIFNHKEQREEFANKVIKHTLDAIDFLGYTEKDYEIVRKA